MVRVLVISAAACSADVALADEGGAGFWIPGSFASSAAVPGEPGWSIETIYYHVSLSASVAVGVARDIEIGKSAPTASAILTANLKSSQDQFFFTPTYTFASPVLGGQASVALAAQVGQTRDSLASSLSTIGPLPTISDSLLGFGDLGPQVMLKWNHDVDNYMVYATGNIPVGAFDHERLSNLGLGFGAIDAGGGYTYFDSVKGHEFSLVTGVTVNLVNPSTQYRNGVDWHLDWGASQFLNKEVFVGAVGYIYKQIGCDSGAGDEVGCFRSQVLGIGPQLGITFPLGEWEGALSVRGYKEFDAKDRPAGWNAWLSFEISPKSASGAPVPASRGTPR